MGNFRRLGFCPAEAALGAVEEAFDIGAMFIYGERAHATGDDDQQLAAPGEPRCKWKRTLAIAKTL